jgi:HK97 family phage major capsid protein
VLTDNEARARLADILAEQESLLDQVKENDSQKFTPGQQRRYDELEKELPKLEAQLKGKIQPAPIKPGGEESSNPEATVLTREQRVADWARGQESYNPEHERLDFGKFIRGAALGRWEDADLERRTMGEATGAGGAFMVPIPLASEVIDLARAKMRTIQAGARTVPMDSQKLRMARWASDPTASWHSESAAVTDSTPTLEEITFTAQTLIALVKTSRELVEDANNLGDALRNSFAQAIALELDRVALRGSGTPPQPKGVRNQTGVTVNELGAGNGLAPTYADLIDFGIAPPENNNFNPNAFIWAPRTGHGFGKLLDGNDNPLQVPELVASRAKLDSTQVPINLTEGTSTDCSEIYCGQFDELLIGMRTEFQLEVLRERYAADNFDVGFLAHLRADIQLGHAKAFAVITGVRP